jgi:hypothetical protein
MIALTFATSTPIGYHLMSVEEDGTWIVGWGIVSNGCQSCRSYFTDDFYQFPYEDASVPAGRRQVMPLPSTLESGLYIICPINDPESPCVLFGVGDLVAVDEGRRACGEVCVDVALGEPIPPERFQTMLAFFPPSVSVEGERPTIFIHIQGRSRPSGFIVESRSSTNDPYQKAFAVLDEGRGEPRLVPADEIESLEVVEVTDGPSLDLVSVELNDRPAAGLYIRICSAERDRMPCMNVRT